MIDAWMQHMTPALLGHPMFAPLLRWMGLDGPPPELPLALTVGAMQAAGVRKAVMTAWWGPQGPLISNDEVAGFIDQHPDLFVGAAAVDLRRPMEAVRELRRCVDQLGFKALRVLPWLWELPPDDRRYYPLYAACVDLQIPFCLQVGHTGPLAPSEPGRPIPYLERVALDFPELVIVGGHIGCPWLDEMIFLATRHPNVYIDTSAYVPRRYPAALVDFIKGRGRRKVLFGTNFPMIAPAQCAAQIDALGLDDEARRLFLEGNAARVFNLDPQPTPEPS